MIAGCLIVLAAATGIVLVIVWIVKRAHQKVQHVYIGLCILYPTTVIRTTNITGKSSHNHRPERAPRTSIFVAHPAQVCSGTHTTVVISVQHMSILYCHAQCTGSCPTMDLRSV